MLLTDILQRLLIPQMFLQGLHQHPGGPGDLRQAEGHRPLELLRMQAVLVQGEPDAEVRLEAKGPGVLRQQQRTGIRKSYLPFAFLNVSQG